jgi:hypothetical protein
MAYTAPTPTPPPVKIPVGPNWKLIRNLFIIAGLLIAISIVWEIRHNAQAKRERINRETVEREKQAKERALAEAREKAEAEARAIREARIREAELAAANIDREREARRPSVETPKRDLPDRDSPTKVPEPEMPAEIVSLTSKARELVTAAGQKRTEQLVENVRKMTWDLDAHHRSLARSEQIQWIPHINRIKNLAKNNRVPDPFVQSQGVALSKKMEDIANFAVSKQRQIDHGFISECAKIHSAYLRKIMEAAKQAETEGQKPLAAALKRKADQAAGLAEWVRSLDVGEEAQIP